MQLENSANSSISVYKEIKISKERYGIFSIRYSPDSQYIAAGYGTGGIHLHDTKTGSVVCSYRSANFWGLPIMCIRYFPTNPNRIVAAGAEGKIYLCNVSQQIAVIGQYQEIAREDDNQINALDFSLDGNTFATAGKDQTVRLYDAKTGTVKHAYKGFNPITDDMTRETTGHGQRIFALRYHPIHNFIFLTGGWDNSVKIWDSRTQDGVERSIIGPHICGDSLDVKDDKILTGSWRGHTGLQIWDYITGQLIDTFDFCDNKTGDFIYCASFFKNNSILAGGSGTNSVFILDTKQKSTTGFIPFDGPIHAMDMSKINDSLAAGGAASTFKLAKIHMPMDNNA